MSSRARLLRWFADKPETVRGIFWGVLASVLFGVMPVFVRLLSETMAPAQIVFLRMSAGLLICTAYYAFVGMAALRTHQIHAYLLRTLFHVSGMVLWFWGIALLPLEQAVALHFTLPLWAVLLAMLFLGERLDPARGLAMLVGFLGVLVILRPGVAEISWAGLIVLAAAALYGANTVVVRFLGRADTAGVITFYSSLFGTLIMAGPALWDWTPLGWGDAAAVLGLGITGTVAPFLFAHALRLADTNAIAPLDFLRLPFASISAVIIFAEIPSLWTWLGAAIIFASAWYVGRRAARAAR